MYLMDCCVMLTVLVEETRYCLLCLLHFEYAIYEDGMW